MTIQLNGKGYEAPTGITVLGLLESIGLAPGRAAVEVNGRVLRREDFRRVSLAENDRVEVVHFVGGG
ncbi:MAG TPA: sulfur carrier protein ThiS [Candidatus Polarisedimenticolia bacterium]|nr:sulfur carrier protein ThiS [Candidatus Polarisedimenticolia bacterium]